MGWIFFFFSLLQRPAGEGTEWAVVVPYLRKRNLRSKYTTKQGHSVQCILIFGRHFLRFPLKKKDYGESFAQDLCTQNGIAKMTEARSKGAELSEKRHPIHKSIKLSFLYFQRQLMPHLPTATKKNFLFNSILWNWMCRQMDLSWLQYCWLDCKFILIGVQTKVWYNIFFACLQTNPKYVNCK